MDFICLHTYDHVTVKRLHSFIFTYFALIKAFFRWDAVKTVCEDVVSFIRRSQRQFVFFIWSWSFGWVTAASHIIIFNLRVFLLYFTMSSFLDICVLITFGSDCEGLSIVMLFCFILIHKLKTWIICCVIVFLLVVGEFGRIAVEFLKKGSNPKIYEGAAREYTTGNVCLLKFMSWCWCLFIDFVICVVGKLNVSSETVQHGVEGLMYLLTESSKLMVCIWTNSHHNIWKSSSDISFKPVIRDSPFILKFRVRSCYLQQQNTDFTHSHASSLNA